MVCKSVTPSRVEANYQMWDFALDDDDMKVNIDIKVHEIEKGFIENSMSNAICIFFFLDLLRQWMT